MKKTGRMSPSCFIVLGFVLVIILGTILLLLPFALKEGAGISVIDALFTSASAVCVTGLAVVDIAGNFSALGQAIVALLIQTGGLGVASIGIGIILLTGKTVTYKERTVVKEALNLDSMKGIVRIIKSVLFMTLCFEIIGAVLCFPVFIRDYPPLRALGISIFHSISSFNNSGFYIFGRLNNPVHYLDNILFNLTTCGLIISGGLGLPVIKELLFKRSFKKLTLYSKVVVTMTLILLATGTIVLKFTEKITWTEAFFYSTSARTAGFNINPLKSLSKAGLFILMILMFIGASPGSTGGGIKTTTAFTLAKSIYSISTNKQCMAFKRKIPEEIIEKAFVITFLSIGLICIDIILLSILEPDLGLVDLLIETVAAFTTVGWATGITPDLSIPGKIIIILTMFIGRLGPLTMASVWINKSKSSVRYSEERMAIG